MLFFDHDYLFHIFHLTLNFYTQQRQIKMIMFKKNKEFQWPTQEFLIDQEDLNIWLIWSLILNWKKSEYFLVNQS